MSTTARSARRPDTAKPRVGLRFTETMTGYVTLGETDPRRGFQSERDRTPCTFRLTIATDDVRRFVAEPEHRAAAAGWVECEGLGGRFPVESGDFNLFVQGTPGVREMRYRLPFTDAAGHQLTLVGYKTVRDDPGADAWVDTTTLFTRILIGHVGVEDDADAVVTAAGVLRIRPLAFARQLTTFRTRGPSLRARTLALQAFGGFFLGQLWRTYGRWLPSRSRGSRS